MAKFKGRVGLVQRVLPRYRADFFDLLAWQCQGGLGVFAGGPRPGEHIPQAKDLHRAQWIRAQNIHILSGRLYLCWQAGLQDWLKAWNPDVLIVEANPRYLSTAGAIRWMKERGRPVIGWGLGAPKTNGALAGLRQARRKAFVRQFDGLIAYSQQGAREYAALGFPKNKIFVAPNAVAPRPELPPKRKPIRGRATALFVGRLQARKRVDALLRACAQLPQNLQPKLMIVGDGSERKNLEAVASNQYPQAEFRGALFGADLEQAFNEADIFVLPGTGGLAVQQAMAHALPVIVAQGDGSQHDLVGPENGWPVPPGDDEALRSALAGALRDAVRLRKMGAASFRKVQESFNLENMVARFIEAIQEVGG